MIDIMKLLFSMFIHILHADATSLSQAKVPNLTNSILMHCPLRIFIIENGKHRLSHTLQIMKFSNIKISEK